MRCEASAPSRGINVSYSVYLGRGLALSRSHIQQRADQLSSGFTVLEVNSESVFFFSRGAIASSDPVPAHIEALLLHSRHNTLGWTQVDERSPRRRDLYSRTHDSHKRQTSMPWRDSNPQSQQASSRRPTPYIT